MKTEILRMECISKTFLGVKALNNVNLNVFKGEVLALLGENGAGKSSLIKILAGVYSKDSGRIYFNEKEVEINSPHDSKQLGISVIHQELNLIPNLSVAENIFLGQEKRQKFFFTDKKLTDKSAAELLDKVDLKIEVGELVKNLSMAHKQMLEIVKALAVKAKLIIMDEPTASLTEKEIKTLKEIICKLRDEGVSIIFISHKFNEVMEVANRIAVLRDGNSMGIYLTEDFSEEKLIKLMAGRELKDNFSKGTFPIGEEILSVENISTKNLLKNVGFTLRKGEILGFAGLIGSGRTELMNVIFGISSKSSGTISIKGKRVEIKTPRDAIKNKIGLVPEERKLQGLILNMSVAENITISSLNRISQIGFINFRMEKFFTKYFMDRLKIKASTEHDKVVYLSGGNQQKVVVSKWLSIKPQIMILDEPTRGVDLGAKREIHSLIRELANEGTGVILISSEMAEVLTMSDRLIIMHEGLIKGELSRHEATQEKVLSLAIN